MYFKSLLDCFLQIKFILSESMAQVLIFIEYIFSTLFHHVFCNSCLQTHFEVFFFTFPAIIISIYFLSLLSESHSAFSSPGSPCLE